MYSTVSISSGTAASPKAMVFDLDALLGRLETLTDNRCPKGRRYALAPTLLMIILAKLAGQDRPSAIADWISARGRLLGQVLRLSWRRMPHHNTYRRILAGAVSPKQLDCIIGEHLCSLPGVGQSVLIAIDGKTVRGTIDRDNTRGEHLLGAYLPQEGVVLMQVSTNGKDNEISVAPQLLGYLDLRGKVVVADAMHTQRGLSIQILAGGGDYLWLAKDNQPALRQEIEELFTADMRTVEGGRVPMDLRQARTLDKGHGRLEERQITVSSELKGHSDWPGLEQVFCLERRRVDVGSGKEEREVVYGLTSLRRSQASAERLLGLVRAYWGIESGLHQRRDVTFQEDRTRLTCGRAGWVMASLNNLVIGLLRQAGATNLASARRQADANITFLLAQAAASSLT
jgi:predicted transposase YbfD/YdcC